MNILITGKNSNIGNAIQNWMEAHSENGYTQFTQLDVITDEWKTFDYSNYDTIIHVAAIVHRPDCKDWSLYKRVNAELPYEIAKLAKAQGVKHFIYISTMAVYGFGKKLNNNEINEKTTPTPKESDYYGMSKYLAEISLHTIEDENFLLSIVRPPNVYGPSGRGGYVRRFTKYLNILPIIPDAYRNDTQSMLYLDNLTELIRQIIIKKRGGVFMPQDAYPVSTVELLQTIAEGKHWKRPTSKFLGALVRLFSFIPLINKIYGGVSYSKELSDIEGINYRIVSFHDGMIRTVQNL